MIKKTASEATQALLKTATAQMETTAQTATAQTVIPETATAPEAIQDDKLEVINLALPTDYLVNGYHATAPDGIKKYLRPEFVGNYAKEIAENLSPLKPTDFASSFLRELKRNKSKALPFEARQTATLEMLPKALALVKRNKAPQILVNFIQANLEAVHNDNDWFAMYRHFEAISGFLSL